MVVTLTLMVLLSILALGLLSLSSIELRKNGVAQAQSLARQNALLALNLAIGELQKNLGPDKRTSATAELLDDSSQNPYWVGAWNTEGGFRGWLISGNETIVQPADPATSVPTGDIPFTPATAATADSTSPTGFSIGSNPAVLLVGEESLGDAASNAKNLVYAPVQDITESAGSKAVGRYAWWVGDEGVKANLASSIKSSPTANSTAERLRFLASSPNRGFPGLGENWEKWLPSPEGSLPDGTQLHAKLATRQQVSLQARELVTTGTPDLAEEAKAGFHDYSISSAGVLSDSKNGGLRKDLSIAFEIPEDSFANSEFTRVLDQGEIDKDLAYATDHRGNSRSIKSGSAPVNRRKTKTAINWTSPEWSSLTNYSAPGASANNPWVYRGPTFDLLRDHYQLYRRVKSPFTSSANLTAQTYLPNATTFSGGGWKQKAAFGDYYGEASSFPGPGTSSSGGGNFEIQDKYDNGNYVRVRPMTTQIIPELIRYSYTFAVQSFKSDHDNNPATPEEFQLRLTVNPFFVLHNPYDVRLISQPVWFNIDRSEFQFDVTVPAQNGNSTDYSTRNKAGNRDRSVNIRKLVNYPGYGNEEDYNFILSDDGSPTSQITMEPGEIKTFGIRGNAPVAMTDLFDKGNKANRNLYFQANLSDFFSTGIYMTVYNVPGYHDSTNTPWKYFTIPADSEMYFTVNADGEGASVGSTWPPLAWKSAEYHTLWSKFIPQGVSSSLDSTQNGSWDQIRQIEFYPYKDYWTKTENSVSQTRFKPTEIEAPPTGRKRYIGKMDMYLKPAYNGPDHDNNSSLATHNPRAMVQSIMVAGAQGPGTTRGPANWTGSLTKLDPASSNSPGFNDRFWGSDTVLPGGRPNVVLFSIPRAPMTSVAAFRNANLSRLVTSPAYAVGNSYASPYVEANRAWHRSYNAPPDRPSSQSPPTINERYWNLDDSYIFNEALFDSYFFSGVNPGTSGSGWANSLPAPVVTLSSDPSSAAPLQESIDDWKSGASPLPNARLIYLKPAGRGAAQIENDLDVTTAYATPQTTLATAADTRPHNSIAAYMQNLGAFNVNSTSVPAWRVLISGMRGAAVDHFSFATTGGSPSMNVTDDPMATPFPRTSIPGADSSTGSIENLWNGFRNLKDSEIEDLAEEIVAEIKARARSPKDGDPRPFTTLGEFVNRRLSTGDFGLKGALQAAIDRSININNDSESLFGEAGKPADTNYKTNKTSSNKEQTTVNYANPAALNIPRITGAPQWFTQADLLEKIGPQLSARSDTFSIRTYGESLDSKGNVIGRAWLEATVQRGSDFVNPNDHPALPVSSHALSETSKEFGRRFHISSFRWLSPAEI